MIVRKIISDEYVKLYELFLENGIPTNGYDFIRRRHLTKDEIRQIWELVNPEG